MGVITGFYGSTAVQSTVEHASGRCYQLSLLQPLTFGGPGEAIITSFAGVQTLSLTNIFCQNIIAASRHGGCIFCVFLGVEYILGQYKVQQNVRSLRVVITVD